MSKPSNTNMRYDDVLCLLGEFGLYQRVVYTLLCLPVMFVGMQIMSPVFILATPNHRCAIPEILNDTYEIQSENHSALVQFYIPFDDIEGGYAKCKYFNRPLTYIETTEAKKANHYLLDNLTVDTIDCHNWVFDKSVFDSTATTEKTSNWMSDQNSNCLTPRCFKNTNSSIDSI